MYIELLLVYAVTGWLIIQVIATIKEPLNLPDKFDTITIILVAVGLPIAVIIAWVLELTPTGIKKTNEIEVSDGFNELTKRKLNRITIAILALVLSLVIFERVFLVGSGFYEETNLSEAVVQQEKSVVVLPFSDFSPEGDQEWYKKDHNNKQDLMWELMHAPEKLDEITPMIKPGPEISFEKIFSKLITNTIDTAEFDSYINRLRPQDMHLACFFYVTKGEQDKAHSIVTIIDASFLGPTRLSDNLNFSAGKIPFRLSAVPNFSARLKEPSITDLVAYEKKNRIKFGK